MIPATPRNIQWLFERLWAAKRSIESQKPCVQQPVFVLLTKDAEDRRKVEVEVLKYLAFKYGANTLPALTSQKNFDLDVSDKQCSRFEIAELDASIMLVDVSDPPGYKSYYSPFAGPGVTRDTLEGLRSLKEKLIAGSSALVQMDESDAEVKAVTNAIQIVESHALLVKSLDKKL